MRGALGINHHSYQLLFSDVVGPPIFSSTMASNRFSFLHANICFDDIDTRANRWPHDKFAAIRDVFELFNRNCGSALNPTDYLSLDETLYPCRNKIAFKQYNPNKPAKYGILYKSVNSARFSYTYQTAVYCGRPVKTPAPYYVQGTSPIVMRLIEELERYSSLKGMNITMDRLYTNIELCEWFLKKNITVLGTIMANRKGIPREMSSIQNREEFSYRVMWENTNKKLSLHSYVVNTKSKGKKNVLALTTLCPLIATTVDDQKNKPAILKLYDFTKGGTDIVDQRMGTYSTNTKANRWTMSVFSFMLDTARVNAQVLWELNQQKIPNCSNSFKFAFQLATDLVHDHINKRNKNPLPITTKHKIAAYMRSHSDSHTSEMSETGASIASSSSRGAAPENPIATTSATASDSPATNVTASAITRKRCFKCVEEKSRLLEAKERRKKQALMSRVTTACKICHKAVCRRHFDPICADCSQPDE